MSHPHRAEHEAKLREKTHRVSGVPDGHESPYRRAERFARASVHDLKDATKPTEAESTPGPGPTDK